MPGLEMKYFVLNPRSKTVEDKYAQASRAAMVAYAENIRETNWELSEDLISWASEENRNRLKLESI